MTLLVNNPRELAGQVIDGVTQMPNAMNVAKAQTLINKRRGESLQQFYARAERDGIARQCCQCNGRRRYSEIRCPYCTQYAFTEIKGQPRKPDLDELAAKIGDNDPASALHLPLDEPEANDGFSYTPIDPNSDEAKALAEEKGAEWNQQTQALQREQARNMLTTFTAMDLPSLFEYAKANNISLGSKTKTKDAVIAKIEAHIGGFKPIQSDAVAATAKALSEMPPA